MTCEEAFELLSAQLDGELSEEETLQLNQHLSGCESCQTLSAELSSIRAVLPDAVEVSPPPELAEHVIKHLPPRKKSGSILRFAFRHSSLVAAALVVALLPVFYSLVAQTPRTDEVSADVAPQDIPALTADTGAESAGGISAYDPAPQSVEIPVSGSVVSESDVDSSETVISHDLRRAAVPEKNARAVTDAGSTQTFCAVLTVSFPDPAQTTALSPQNTTPYPQENGDEWYYLPLEEFDSYLQNLESSGIDFQLEEGDPDQTTALVIVAKS